jgi:PPP family 3-phenylpropionic acid transporter
MRTSVSYWRLSNFYLFFLASVGALVPYWSLYLKSLGFSASDIGELMAVIMATKIIAPNLWGWVADRSGQKILIVRLGVLMALITFASVFVVQGYWWMALVMAIFSFFWNAALPQFEATTMSLLGDDAHRYGSIRLWGSIGFILAVVGVGKLLESSGAEVIPITIVTMLFCTLLATLWVPREPSVVHVAHHESIMQVLLRPEVLVVLLVCFLLQLSHGPYYIFFTIYLEDHGYSRGLIGQLWALGVVAEIGVFLLMHRLLPRYGARLLLLISLALTALRWLLLAWCVEWLSVLLFAQLLHAASFGLYHAVAIHLIHKFFTGRHQGRGQALYSSFSFGAGGAVGSLISGYLWESAGAGITYSAAAMISLLAWLLAWRFIKPSI